MTTKSSNQPKDKTPSSIDFLKDARTEKGAGTYPNYYTFRTRSGHVLTMDDSEDHESVTLQHRGGSMLQFMPDGAVQFVAQNGQYTVVFGENRIYVTGAQDVIVKGDCSLRVDGDYNATVMGNYNVAVDGDFNLNAKNMNAQIRGDVDLNAKNLNAEVEGSSSITSHGTTTFISDGGLALSSESESIALRAGKDVGLKAAGGAMMIESQGKMSLKSGGNIAADGTYIDLNSGEADSAVVVIPKSTDPNPKNPNEGLG